MKSSVFFNMSIYTFTAFVLLNCQAAQSKTEKQPVKQPPAAEASVPDTTKADTGKASVQENLQIIVYYFHGNMRCHTCYNLENYAKLVVESDFLDAIKSGKLKWKTVNVETAGNEHFNNDYKLYTKSIIVSTLQDGKEVSWKNLDQIWQLIHNEPEYKDYIKREVKACLEGKCL